MYVNDIDLNNYIRTWIYNQSKQLGYHSESQLSQIDIQIGIFCHILQNIDDQYFNQLNSKQSQKIEDVFHMIQVFLAKECGKSVQANFKNKLLNEGSLQILMKLILHCCLHSKQKDMYISRILKLQVNVQTALMEAVKQVNQHLLNLITDEDILFRVQELEMQCQLMRNQSLLSKSREQQQQKIIQQLEEQLDNTKQQLKSYKIEKQKVMEILDLTNIDQYLSSFRRLQQENKNLNRYLEELEDSNNQYKQNERTLKKDIQNQSTVIVRLNDHITLLKQKIQGFEIQCATSIKFNLFNLDDTLDVTQSFGVDLSSKQNEQSFQVKKVNRKNLHILQQSLNQSNLANINEQLLLEQMQQLRKYNNDLTNKLDTAYKIIHTLTTEASMLKEQNQILTYQNKFNKKRHTVLLKKYHQIMEIEGSLFPKKIMQ